MKKTIVFLLLMFGIIGAAFAQSPPYGIYVTQASSDGTFFYGRYMTPADINTSYLYMYDGSTQQPKAAAIGAGLSYSSGTLSATSSGTVSSVTAGTGLSGGTITSTGTISMPNTGTAGTYSSVTTDAQGRVTAGTNRSFVYQTRALNTCFQISSTRDALVTYAVDIATSLSLTAGQQGTVYLRIYSNSSCSTGTQEIMRFSNGQTGTLTIGLALNQNVTAALHGVIPAGSWVQLVTENNTGTPTFTARPGQEVLL